MAFDSDIQDYVNASTSAIDLTYNSMWEKIADKIRQNFNRRGVGVGSDVIRVMGDSQQKFSQAVEQAKARVIAEAYRLQAGRAMQREQQKWYEKMQQQQYADTSGYMNRAYTAAAMGGYGSDMSTHEDRAKAFAEQDWRKGLANYYRPSQPQEFPGSTAGGTSVSWPFGVEGTFNYGRIPTSPSGGAWTGGQIRLPGQLHDYTGPTILPVPTFGETATPLNPSQAPPPWMGSFENPSPNSSFNAANYARGGFEYRPLEQIQFPSPGTSDISSSPYFIAVGR